jgi:hypothetical protein
MNNQNKIIFLIGRDNSQKDDSLNHDLIEYLETTKHEIIWYEGDRWDDPASKILDQLHSFENKIKWLPYYLKKINRRSLLLFYAIFHWSYFNYVSDRRNPSVEFRAQKLKKKILTLGEKKEIIIICRSAGGRFVSCIADQIKIKHIICLGYPFKHPNEPIDSDRYIHLTNLKTPMLIIQGERDEYGGLDIIDKYILSQNIKLFFVDTNHNFKLSEDDWERVLNKVNDIIY